MQNVLWTFPDKEDRVTNKDDISSKGYRTLQYGSLGLIATVKPGRESSSMINLVSEVRGAQVWLKALSQWEIR